ncbi:hypothetical protein FXO37_30144 [Capsicum annuum]|nr:hypothetical protein FXO37_30144 [Capsicum annuum]
MNVEKKYFLAVEILLEEEMMKVYDCNLPVFDEADFLTKIQPLMALFPNLLRQIKLMNHLPAKVLKQTWNFEGRNKDLPKNKNGAACGSYALSHIECVLTGIEMSNPTTFLRENTVARMQENDDSQHPIEFITAIDWGVHFVDQMPSKQSSKSTIPVVLPFVAHESSDLDWSLFICWILGDSVSLRWLVCGIVAGPSHHIKSEEGLAVSNKDIESEKPSVPEELEKMGISSSVNPLLSLEISKFEEKDRQEESVKHLGKYCNQLKETAGKKNEKNTTAIVVGERAHPRRHRRCCHQSQAQVHTQALYNPSQNLLHSISPPLYLVYCAQPYVQLPSYSQWCAPTPQSYPPTPQIYQSLSRPDFRSNPTNEMRQNLRDSFTPIRESYASLFHRLVQRGMITLLLGYTPDPNSRSFNPTV